MGDKLEREIMLVAEQIEMEILILLVLFWIRVETVLYIFKKGGGLIFFPEFIFLGGANIQLYFTSG